jgi:cytochrome b subunit of formate dehydrogenase
MHVDTRRVGFVRGPAMVATRKASRRRAMARLRWLLLPLSLAHATLAGAAADDPSADDCLSCHREATKTDAGRAVTAIGPAPYRASVHSELACTVCHTDASSLPHGAPLDPVGLDTCGSCHADAVDEYRASVHGTARGQGVPEAASCASCHGDLHAVRAHDDPESPTHWTRLTTQCARCHADRALVEKAGIPVVRPVEAYLQSAHAREIAGRRAATCTDCHGTHGIRSSGDPASSISRRRVPETCGVCHADALAAYRDSVHGVALARGVTDTPVCTDCHGEHRIQGPAEPTSPVFAANVGRETCGRCHGDARLNEKYGLPAGNVAAYEDSFHGMALRGGRLTVANCSSCHGVHDIRPSTDPRSHVNPANLAATCGKCHPGAGTKLQLGPVHKQRASLASGAVGWIRVVYLWLIGLAVGGMVLHNLADLARKAVTPLPPARALPDAPERMPRAVRLQHGLLMISFPILTYTGFALTYPEHWWAAPLLHWEATLGLRGGLHRAAALVMMGALLWHAVHVAVSPGLRVCLRGSLPSRADARLAAGMLAYWTGRRAHPPSVGPWHYAEKVEYWAFLWGTVLMSTTGLVLWFHDVTLRWLPSGITDVATALHFYEAVLASLAILVWHLYWVVFDPAVYPMDWTWWTGRSPARRTLERLADAPPDRGGDGPEGDDGSSSGSVRS